MFPTASVDANVVRFRVFFRAPHAPPQAATAEQDRAFVSACLARYNGFVASLLGEFIWHKHRLHFTLSRHAIACGGGLRAWCLQGECDVGDAIDDEWVVTWLLFQLTTEFPLDDAIVTIHDTDGEFLLIECADVLPPWVSPENSAGRVFVHRGHLHLVPVSVVPETALTQFEEEDAWTHARPHHAIADDDHPVLVQSLRAFVDDVVDTRVSIAMQRVLAHKLREPPRYIECNRHTVRCWLPSRAAVVVETFPEIIGAAVEAFFYREPTQAAKICQSMAAFTPRTCVRRRVTFSKCQYAQLKQQQFYPPKPFLHLPGADRVGDLQSVETTATEIGVKLACGLEVLYASDESDQFGTRWRHRMDQIDASVAAANDTSQVPDDDDAWLYLHPDTLDERLHRIASRSGPGGDTDDVDDVGGAEELHTIATMFNNFMSGVSGLDGVENAEPVQLDMSAFMDILNGTGGQNPDEDEEEDEDDDADEWDDPASSESNIDSDDEVEDEPDEDDAEDRILREAMAEMDAELGDSTLAKTFTRVANATASSPSMEASSSHDQDDPDRPLDLDFNLLSNLLESLASQEGMAGPVSNLLSELTSSTTKRYQ